MILVEITKSDYIDSLHDFREECKYTINIDENQISTKYYALVDSERGVRLASAGLVFQKNSMVYINGLFSNFKGSGKEFVNGIASIGIVRFITLNCTGSKLKDYYKSLGFEVILEDNDFYELRKDLR